MEVQAQAARSNGAASSARSSGAASSAAMIAQAKKAACITEPRVDARPAAGPGRDVMQVSSVGDYPVERGVHEDHATRAGHPRYVCRRAE